MSSSKEEFEKLSEAQQNWVTEVMSLLGQLDGEKQKDFIALGQMLAASNEPQHVKA